MSATSPAGSPPAPSAATLPNPRKRPSLPGPGTPGAKRRKPSTYSASGSAHPLRQTSFPPEDSALSAGGLRSPSVETDVTHSVAASVTGGGGGGKRGRKRKSNVAGGAETASVRSGPSAKGGTPGRGRGDTASRAGGQDENEAADEADEDDDELGEDEVDIAGQAMEEEKYRYSILWEAGDEKQRDRLSQYRSTHLDTSKVRRIVNQTLSQSVPKGTIRAISAYSKHFICTLIERAIDIQRNEALAAAGVFQPPEEEDDDDEGDEADVEMENGVEKDCEARGIKKEGSSGDANGDKMDQSGSPAPNSNGTVPGGAPRTNGTVAAGGGGGGSSSSIPSTPTTPGLTRPPQLAQLATQGLAGSAAGSLQSPRTPAVAGSPLSAHPDGVVGDTGAPTELHRRQFAGGREIAIGPLRPDSLREALRRLKREGGFGGVGLEGVSTGLGVQGMRSSMMAGRRLFR